ncbi:MAG: hypothetical protein ACLQT7_00015 [Candidatus Dormibacteria bacterium]
MRARRGRRRRQRAQAALEMALVLWIMLAIVFCFVGMMLELRAENEFQTAVDLAAQSALVPPLGDSADSQSEALYAFTHTLNPSGGEHPYLTVTAPISCTGPYLSGEIVDNSEGFPEPVTCTAQATVDFSQTPVSLLWFWDVRLSATAEAYPPTYRRCENPLPANSANPNQC